MFCGTPLILMQTCGTPLILMQTCVQIEMAQERDVFKKNEDCYRSNLLQLNLRNTIQMNHSLRQLIALVYPTWAGDLCVENSQSRSQYPLWTLLILRSIKTIPFHFLVITPLIKASFNPWLGMITMQDIKFKD